MVEAGQAEQSRQVMSSPEGAMRAELSCGNGGGDTGATMRSRNRNL